MGPWRFEEVVVPSFAHNVKPFRHPDGTFLIYYVGSVNNATEDCSNNTLRLGTAPLPKEAAGPVMIASATSAAAPATEWALNGPMTDSVGWHSATNPSPVFYANGSVLMAVARRWDLGNGRADKNNWFMAADSWRGPYHNLTQRFEDAAETGEDPDMFK